MYSIPGKCCVCGSKLNVTRLSCPECHTEITGEFEGCKFCALPKEQTEFMLVFLRCRGNIKEIEKELGISYPTVKNMTDNLLSALGLKPKDSAEAPLTKSEILKMLERKEISSDEAMRMIKEL